MIVVFPSTLTLDTSQGSVDTIRIIYQQLLAQFKFRVHKVGLKVQSPWSWFMTVVLMVVQFLIQVIYQQAVAQFKLVSTKSGQ